MNGGTESLRLEVFSKRGRLICRTDRTKGLPGIMRVTDWLSDSFWGLLLIMILGRYRCWFVKHLFFAGASVLFAYSIKLIKGLWQFRWVAGLYSVK